MTTISNIARRLACATALTGWTILAAPPVAAITASFHQPESSLDSALKAYGTATGRQIFYPSALVEGRRAPALDGRLDAEQALRRLLDGQPIMVVRSSGKLVVLGARTATPSAPVAARPSPRSSGTQRRTVGAQDAEPKSADIIVTGTNIRGQAPTSQLLAISERDIAQSGYANVADIMAALPQNFGGVATEDSLSTGSDRSIPNVGFGSGVNLRGLGPDATLVLVNGRRVAGAGGKGDFTDISSIPLAALARVEILTDGASAIYGSDAVGGVVNMILKTDFEGAETRLRYGGVTRGSLRDVQIGQLAGARWSSGHILAAYEYNRRGALASKDRAYTRSGDLRPLGGDDFRTIYGMPGTVLRFDAGLGTYVAGFRIPDNQTGTGLTAASFAPGANLNNLREGTDILPRQTRHIGYVYAEQEVGDRLRLFAEGRYAHRRFFLRTPAFFTVLPVTRANPFFVSPTGAASDVIGYSFSREFGPIRNNGTVRTWTAAGGGKWEAGQGWTIAFDASHGEERTFNHTENYGNTAYLFEAVGATTDSPATAFSVARDGYFNPYGSGASNSPAILNFINAAYSMERDRSRIDQLNLKADGALIDLPGGSLRVAVGGAMRWDHFERTGESFTDTLAPVVYAPTDTTRRVAAGFAELAVPIFGASNAMPGLRELLLTAALRHEHYEDIGDTTNPKIGLAWKPTDSLKLRGSWSRSFRAPAIKELTDPLRVVTTTYINASGARTPVLVLTGGNPALEPETAQSWSAGGVWQPDAVDNLRLEINWFRTSFKDQIGRPAFENSTRVLRDPAFSPFVQAVNPSANADDLALLQAYVATPGAATSIALPLASLRAIVDSRYVNTARTVVQGIDIGVNYALALGSGTLSTGANMSWLIDYKSQPTITSRLIERVSTIGNPADLRARLTTGWDNKVYGVTLAANMVGRYRDDISQPNRSIAPWTTIDLQLRYAPQTGGILDGMTIALSVTNIFANDPPFVNNAAGFGYDPANADPLGRFASLSLTKRW